jgi:hypothetical protein
MPPYFKTLLLFNGSESADLGHTNLSKNHNLATARNKRVAASKKSHVAEFVLH